MSDPAIDGIHLTKKYYKDFSPTDLQWTVSKVDDDFTLYDLFRLVYHANLMTPGIFSTFGMSQFDAFWEQINLGRDPNDTDDVTYLELYWHLSYDTSITKKTNKSTDQKGTGIIGNNKNNYWDDPKVGELPNLMSFHGIGPGCPSADFHECNDNCPKDQGYGIEFTPVNNLKHLPIRVSPEINFFPPYVESDREFHRTGFKLTIEPTLWCFITSIFWELTFGGPTPSGIASYAKEIYDSIDKVRKQLKKDRDEENNNNTIAG